MTDDELKALCGTSEHGNYAVTGTIGIPHPYCITEKHVVHAADRYGGMLGGDCIRDAEKRGLAKCGMQRCDLSYDQHETGLVVTCTTVPTGNIPVGSELHNYLLKCKELTEGRNYAGFAFMPKPH